MKKVSLEDIKKTGKWVLPVGIVALGFASVMVSQPSATGSKAAITTANSQSTQAQGVESPAPTAVPHVTVNGTRVPTDADGSTTVELPGGKARVEVSGGHTEISASSNSTSGDTSNSQSGNVDVSVDSQSDGGTNWGSTQVYGFNQSSNDSGTSFSSTSIFSAGSDHVSVSHSQ